MEMPLAEKIGPLPIYAYVGIGVLGVLIYHRYHSASGASAPVQGSDSASPDTADQSGLAYGGTDSGTGTVAIPGQYSPGATGVTDYSTNQEWAIGAADYLAGLGYSPQDVNSAINNYINGQPLITSARDLITKAIEHQGNAPEGPINLISAVPAPPVTAPKPPVKPAPRPVTHPVNRATLPKTSPGRGKVWLWNYTTGKWYAGVPTHVTAAHPAPPKTLPPPKASVTTTDMRGI